jgi:hypothetical protein
VANVGLTANQVAAHGPLPGDVGLYAKELACQQRIPTPGYYSSLNGAEISDSERSGRFPCATFTGSFDGPNQVYAWRSETDYPGISYINSRKPGELYLVGGEYPTLDDPNMVGPFMAKAEATTGKELWRTYLDNLNGFLMRAVAENERQEVATYLKGLQGLLEQYTLPTAGKVLDFMLQAQVTGADAAGLVSMTGHGVVVPGDTFTVWADPRTRQTRKVQVASTFEGNVVNLNATFQTLPSRLTYVSYAEVTVPAKQITVQVQNFDFSRPEQPVPMILNVPAPAPTAVSSSQAAAVKKLKELKSLLDQGLITQAQYDADSQRLVSELVK